MKNFKILETLSEQVFTGGGINLEVKKSFPLLYSCHTELVSASHNFDKKKYFKKILEQVHNNVKCAFTLTEVIVVIVIIAALAIILIPNMLSLMPDDHNVKYKKTFYTVQKIVNDIVQECQGLVYYDGTWYSVEEWNDKNMKGWDDASLNVDSDNVLSFCYNDDGTEKYLDREICKRLNTINNIDCNSLDGTGDTYIQTTNGMKWFITHKKLVKQRDGGTWGFDEGDLAHVYVIVDGKDVKIDPMGVDNRLQKLHDKGIYIVQINSKGKVIPYNDNKEKDYLFNNPTKD